MTYTPKEMVNILSKLNYVKYDSPIRDFLTLDVRKSLYDDISKNYEFVFLSDGLKKDFNAFKKSANNIISNFPTIKPVYFNDKYYAVYIDVYMSTYSTFTHTTMGSFVEVIKLYPVLGTYKGKPFFIWDNSYQYDLYPGKYEFGENMATRIWDLKSDTFRFCFKNATHEHNLPANWDFDFLGNRIFNKLDYKHKFFIVNDFKKQKQDDNISKLSSPKLGYKGISYNDCKGFIRDQDAIRNKYGKTLNKIEKYQKVNLNKLTFVDIQILKKVFKLLIPHEFVKFYNWFIKHKDLALCEYGTTHIDIFTEHKHKLAKYFYTVYLCSRIGLLKTDHDYINNADKIPLVFNYVDHLTRLNPKKHSLAVPYNGYCSIEDQEKILSHNFKVKLAIKRYGNKIKQDVISVRPKWQQLLNNIKQNKNIIPILKPIDLADEGSKQHNCLGTYIDNYMKDSCGLILRYNDKKHDEIDSLEVIQNKKGHYKIKQIYAKYDHKANSANKKYLERIFNKK